jgi:ubiquinone biosynthesis protein
LFEITALFDMTTRVELVMLQKTMVVVEGVARKLDPQLNIWSTAEPVVGAWIANNLGPAGRLEDLSRGVSSLAAFLADAPRRLEDLASRLDGAAESELGERLYNRPPQSRVANTTIVVIAISLTVVAILWYRWWH